MTIVAEPEATESISKRTSPEVTFQDESFMLSTDGFICGSVPLPFIMPTVMLATWAGTNSTTTVVPFVLGKIWSLLGF